MRAEQWIAIAGIAATVIVSLGVTWMTLRHQRRLERDRQLFAERAELYVDALTEAYAERNASSLSWPQGLRMTWSTPPAPSARRSAWRFGSGLGAQ